MHVDAIYIEPIVTRKPEPEPPPSFVCAICERTAVADRWRAKQHRPPICISCEIYQGHQVRFAGITRGDHTTLKRLTAVTNALMRAARWEPKYGRVRSI